MKPLDEITGAIDIPYPEIPGLPQSTVPGHGGFLRAGQLGGQPVLALCGRVHLYEGTSAAEVVLPVRVLAELGVRTLILTNAAGALNPDFAVGSLMLIADHINMTGQNPLTGPNHEPWGPRFPDQSQVYHPDLHRLLRLAAQDAGLALAEGIYAFTAGPCYETPAEIRSYAAMGADAVGMSTVPEAVVANAAGLRVAALSCITNMAAGISGPHLSHDEVMVETRRVAPLMGRLLDAFLKRLA